MYRKFWVCLMGGLVLVLAFMSTHGVKGGPDIAPAPQHVIDQLSLTTTPISSTFTYQGQIKQDNKPVTGSCEMAFRLYDDPSAGSLIGSPITSTVPVTNGLFVAQLDFGGSAFDGNARWLDIQVNCGAGLAQLIPRQQLTAAPYALYALNSGTTQALQGRAITTTAPISGQVLKWNGTAWTPALDEIGLNGEYWTLTGNAGTTPGMNFLGTTDPVSLTIIVSGTAALRIIPHRVYGEAPSLISGSAANSAREDIVGVTISGGGSTYGPNRVIGDFGTIGGGANNHVGETLVGTPTAHYGTVSGGQSNTVDGYYPTISGGGNNTAGSGGTVSGGQQNHASSMCDTVSGGFGNTANGGYATISGGVNNTASDVDATISGGENNTANGMLATIGGGLTNQASAPFSTIPGGYRANALLYGQLAYASGGFTFGSYGPRGEAQTSIYVLRNTTPNATNNELFLDGSTQRLTISNGRTLTFDILVAARSDANASAGYKIQGVITNDSGTTRFIGTPTVTTLGEDNNAWSVTVQADDTNDALIILVSGTGSPNTIRWVATVRTAEVAW